MLYYFHVVVKDYNKKKNYDDKGFISASKYKEAFNKLVDTYDLDDRDEALYFFTVKDFYKCEDVVYINDFEECGDRD